MDIYNYLEENFKLYTNEIYRDCDLSNTTKRILCDFGLPEEPLHFIQFSIKSLKKIKFDSEHIIIGNDMGTTICINKRDEIVSIDPKHEYPTRFVSSNLETLLSFIVIFLTYMHKDSDKDYDITKVVYGIRREFVKIDAKALEDDENWWAIILEQFEFGLI